MESKAVEQNKVKSTAVRDGLLLVLITFAVSVMFAFVYEITKDPIAQQEELAKTTAYQQVYSDLGSTESTDELTSMADSFTEVEGISIDEALLAKDTTGNVTGLLMTVTTNQGYNGTITFALGYKEDKTVTGISFLTLAETPGLGMNAKKPEFIDQYEGQTDSFALIKGGSSTVVIDGTTPVDGISSATITSRAVTNAVNAALSFAQEVMTEGIGGLSNE